MTASVLPESHGGIPFSWSVISNTADRQCIIRRQPFRFDTATVVSHLTHMTNGDNIRRLNKRDLASELEKNFSTNIQSTLAHSAKLVSSVARSKDCSTPTTDVKQQPAVTCSESVSTQEHDDNPWSGLTGYIKKCNQRKRYNCLRCGSLLQPAKKSDRHHHMVNRSKSWPNTVISTFKSDKKSADKQVYKCCACGRLYTDLTQSKRLRKRSSFCARRVNGVRRTITWPLPMDSILELEEFESLSDTIMQDGGDDNSQWVLFSISIVLILVCCLNSLDNIARAYHMKTGFCKHDSCWFASVNTFAPNKGLLYQLVCLQIILFFVAETTINSVIMRALFIPILSFCQMLFVQAFLS